MTGDQKKGNSYPNLTQEAREKRIKLLLEERDKIDKEYRYYQNQIEADWRRREERLRESYVGRSFRAVNTNIRDRVAKDEEIWFYIVAIENNMAKCIVVLENMICIETLNVFSKPIRRILSERACKKTKMFIEECDEIPAKAFEIVLEEVFDSCFKSKISKICATHES